MSVLLHCQLWMGGLEPYMNEGFIMEAFQRMGENPQNVKIMKNKFTGEPAGYCFVHFSSDEAALNAMHKLSGKIIPNTNPPLRFKLNHAGPTIRSSDREFSLWVGDLTPDVDDYSLYRTFASRYPSTRTAKVILDSQGYSKGYGFIRFASEEEQKNCLIQMNGFKNLGSKPLKISNAIPKISRIPNSGDGYNSSQDYSGYYDSSYWQNYAAWQNYYDSSASNTNAPITDSTSKGNSNSNQEDELELIEHNTSFDVERCNRELVEQDYILWDALESSKWLPVEGLECV